MSCDMVSFLIVKSSVHTDDINISILSSSDMVTHTSSINPMSMSSTNHSVDTMILADTPNLIVWTDGYFSHPTWFVVPSSSNRSNSVIDIIVFVDTPDMTLNINCNVL